MAIIERDVVLQGKTADGSQTIDLPITALKNIEDTADIKEIPTAEDYVPVIDSADSGQMKKMPFRAVDCSAVAEQAALNRSAIGMQKKNLLKENNNSASITIQGINWIKNDDGTLTISGTASADSDYYLSGNWKTSNISFKSDDYLISCEGLTKGVRMYVLDYSDGINQNTIMIDDSDDHKISANITGIYFQVAKGTEVNGLVLKPMLRYADITDNTYEPYADDLQTQIDLINSVSVKNRGYMNSTMGIPDFNNAVESGPYQFSNSPANNPNPKKADEYGMLFVMANGDYISQICHVFNSVDGVYGAVYFRHSIDRGKSWKNWNKLKIDESYETSAAMQANQSEEQAENMKQAINSEMTAEEMNQNEQQTEHSEQLSESDMTKAGMMGGNTNADYS